MAVLVFVAWLEAEGGDESAGEFVGVVGEGFLFFFESDGFVVVLELLFDEFYFGGCPADAGEDAGEFDGVAVALEVVDDVDVVVFG